VAGEPPRMRAPPGGPLQPPTPREPCDGSLQPLASRKPPTGPLRPPAHQEPPATPFSPSIASTRHSKPQERPPISVGRPKCLTNKNNDKI
jgi:hypothetical protein